MYGMCLRTWKHDSRLLHDTKLSSFTWCNTKYAPSICFPTRTIWAYLQSIKPRTVLHTPSINKPRHVVIKNYSNPIKLARCLSCLVLSVFAICNTVGFPSVCVWFFLLVFLGINCIALAGQRGACELLTPSRHLNTSSAPTMQVYFIKLNST